MKGRPLVIRHDRVGHAPSAAEPCHPGGAHRWRLPEPNGPSVVGECSRCGGRREFRSSIEHDHFDYLVTGLR